VLEAGMAEQALHDVLRVVAFAGSLRRGSFNRALLEAARQLAPGRMTISSIEIGDLPFYNADVEAEGDPALSWSSKRRSARRTASSLLRRSTTTASRECSRPRSIGARVRPALPARLARLSASLRGDYSAST